MKNISLLLVFTFIWILGGTMQAHALFLQAPSEINYPYRHVLSQPIDIMPEGSITINVGDETYYYYSGIFYQKIIRDQQYVAVPPPIGAVVFTIPTGYQIMLIDGVPYYEYEGVYYKRVLDGYKITYPPV